MQTIILALVAALSILTALAVWRLQALVEDVRAEIADNYAVMCAYLADDFDEEDDGEPDGVQPAGPADCDDYAYTPVPLYDGQGWHTGDRGHA